MDATTETIPASTRENSKNRPGALIWFLRKSRDGWKRKYLDLKSSEKGYKNRIADLTKSRQQWRTQAEQVGQRLAVAETELRAERAAAEKKKRTSAAAR